MSHVCTKMEKVQSDFTRLSVYLSTILEFHNKWLLFLGHHCISFLIISSNFCKTLQLLRSSGNTHTRTDYYNPPPTLGLIRQYWKNPNYCELCFFTIYWQRWLWCHNIQFYIQWNLSIVDTIGTDQSVLIIEVSSFQMYSVALYTKATFGTPESVLIIEVSLFQSVLIREVPLYNHYYSVQWNLSITEFTGPMKIVLSTEVSFVQR